MNDLTGFEFRMLALGLGAFMAAGVSMASASALCSPRLSITSRVAELLLWLVSTGLCFLAAASVCAGNVARMVVLLGDDALILRRSGGEGTYVLYPWAPLWALTPSLVAWIRTRLGRSGKDISLSWGS